MVSVVCKVWKRVSKSGRIGMKWVECEVAAADVAMAPFRLPWRGALLGGGTEVLVR